MILKIFKIFFSSIIINIFLISFSNAELIKEIKITGNDRISDETILMFSKININDDINNSDLNDILKTLYETNFFKNISLNFTSNILEIKVIENPIIQNIVYEGIKSNKIKDLIVKNSKLKSRSSYDDLILKNDLEQIKIELKNLGYFFPLIETYIEDLNNNKINLTYNIDLGEKAKIKKISFIGDKQFKDKKLKSIIVSEENKFWKFITSKKIC